MAEQGLFDTVYTPDVLTCLANLSNDEVFTPPVVANAMLDLLPQELFRNPDTTFLDPATKSGVFLREIAKRLIVGLEPQFPDLQDRLDHIFHKQLFGIAITDLTAMLSRRSVYCSKYPESEFSASQFDKEHSDGNIRYRTIQHTWKNGKCVFCGVSQKTELGSKEREAELETHAYEWIHSVKPEAIWNMKFDVIISNPPYQLDDGGAQASAMPIYNLFVEQAKKLKPNYVSMIIPSRWFSGGKNLDSFRISMLGDSRICALHDFWDASDCFPGVEIKGGVCYFLWDKSYNGDCTVFTHEGNRVLSEMKRPLLEKDCDVFIRQNEAIEILQKIRSFGEPSFATVVKSAMTFGFRTFFDDFDLDYPGKGYVKIYAKHKQGYIVRGKVQKGTEFIDKWKVYVPEAIGSGDTRTDVIKPILGEPNSICSETYVMNGPWETEEEAKNVCDYIRTKFFHFMIGLKKITQHTTSKVYDFVPMQDFTHSWSDEELYQKYGLDSDQIAYIEKAVWPEKTGGDK